MKKFCLDLREHVTKIINYEKKKFVIYAGKNLIQMIAIKNTIKQKIIVIIQENTEVLLMIFAT